MKQLFVLAALLAASLGPCRAEENWMPVREISLELQPGSPLDFSAMLPNLPIGEESRIVVNAQGHFARADELEKPTRFLCAALGWSPASGGFPDHEQAERYARQLRMHGYNIARFHFVDASLMAGRNADFDVDPELLDRFHYLMAALKRNGIYWIMDGMTSARGAYGGYDDRWEADGDLKLSVYFDESAFQHWLRFQKTVLAKVNPYTGMTPLSDPALVMVIPFNENGIEFDSIAKQKKGKPDYSPRLQPAFNAWLKRRYGTTRALSDAWGYFSTTGTIEAATVALPGSRRETGKRMLDFQAFVVDTERGLADRMEKALRSLGFRGAVAAYNNWPSIQTSLSRERQQAIAFNTYHDWVSSYEPGSTIQGNSSLEDGAFYMRALAASRWLGRPFVLTEYDQLFWNPYRYESGLVIPAYAALQNWDAICRHGHGPIVLAYGEDYPHKRQMLPYAIALDPVARAGETLAALLYRRGDVSGARFAIAFEVRGEADLPGDAAAREPDVLTEISVISAIGLMPAGHASAKSAALVIPQPRPNVASGDLAALLREKGIIDARQAAAMIQQTYISDTGEIRLEPLRRILSVATPRTEAAAFITLEDNLTLGAVSVRKATSPGLFAVSSLDGMPLSKSRRMLVIFATDAHNTGMRFEDRAQKVIADFGRLPVTIRKSAIEFSLAGEGQWRLSPVGLDGKVHPPLGAGQGEVKMNLSNETPQGPTTYFLLERF